MKRQLCFDYAPEENAYIIKEDNNIIFRIDCDTLQFDSLAFYKGLYAGNKSTAIDYKNITTIDPLKKATYIFDWISEIIKGIEEELPAAETANIIPLTTQENADTDVLDDEAVVRTSIKMIPLFEWPACAGEGFYFDQNSVPFEDIEAKNENADYAVTVSGKSMEPTIHDGSILMVKQVDTLSNGDIGIFNVNGEIMCKRYCTNGLSITLSPDNHSGEYSDYDVSKVECTIQGKVLL